MSKELLHIYINTRRGFPRSHLRLIFCTSFCMWTRANIADSESVELPNRKTAIRGQSDTGLVPSPSNSGFLTCASLNTSRMGLVRLLSMHTRHNTGRFYRRQFRLIGAELIREIGELDRITQIRVTKFWDDSSSKKGSEIYSLLVTN